MAPDIAKLCADHLRETVDSENGEKLKSSHAHELVAACFGYKSRAALLAETDYPLSALGGAKILVPDVPLIEERRARLSGLPAGLPSSYALAAVIGYFLKEEKLFKGQLWLNDNLEACITGEFLHQGDAASKISNALSGVMAETNAIFDDAHYEDAVVTSDDDEVVVEVTGTFHGDSDPERPFSGDKINMSVAVTLPRHAGRSSFGDPEIHVEGELDDGWYGPD